MRRLRALPVLMGLLGCRALNPALRYEEMARQLRFTLDRVEPQVELAFPIEQSRLRLKLDIGVENPTDQPLRSRHVGGDLRLDVLGESHALGQVVFPAGVEIAPRGLSTLRMEMVFGYQEVKASWIPLSQAVFRQQRAIWRLDGQATLDVLGIQCTVPLRVSRETGR